MTRPSTRRYGRALPVALMLLLLAPLQLYAGQAKDQSVTLLSDIHFDPFHDPAKFARLRKAAYTAWPGILDSPDSATQAADFNALQKTCGARGEDTSNDLLKSSIGAAKSHNPKPLFVTLSGDLMAHDFPCRFKTLAPDGTPAEYSAFAAKTISFVAYELWLAYPDTPVYISLGNNDSGCGDYEEDPGSFFLKSSGNTIAGYSRDPRTRYAILHQFFHYGDYNVNLPKPMNHTHLIVLQDIFESKKFKTCAAATPAGNMTPAEMQIVWLRKQLAMARKAHQKVWVMAHIPPGVDAYATLSKGRNVCGGDAPEDFLASDALLNAIRDYGDVVRLALFGHTHMDELRVYKANKSDADSRGPDVFIPGKLVPSISPVNGNNPAFLIADVDPASATIDDYTAFVASNKTGIDTTWTKEYRFSDTYQLANLSGASLERLISGMVDDKAGSTPQSTSYQQYFYSGGNGKATKAMRLAWPLYTCAVANGDAKDFRSCTCPADPAVATASRP